MGAISGKTIIYIPKTSSEISKKVYVTIMEIDITVFVLL